MNKTIQPKTKTVQFADLQPGDCFTIPGKSEVLMKMAEHEKLCLCLADGCFWNIDAEGEVTPVLEVVIKKTWGQKELPKAEPKPEANGEKPKLSQAMTGCMPLSKTTKDWVQGKDETIGNCPRCSQRMILNPDIIAKSEAGATLLCNDCVAGEMSATRKRR